ncbi:MAG: Bax inhibitor-1 family protein [Verrucomicrobiota bacterium]
MEQYANPYVVAAAQPSERATFIRKTYLHLAGAIAAFVGIEAFLFNSPLGIAIANAMMGVSWLVVLGLFIGVSWIADKWALSDASRGKQYAGLALTVVAWAIIFVPILAIATQYSPDAIAQAAIVTGFLFLGITATAFITKMDFSFLSGFLAIGGLVALGTIVCGILFGFNLGTWFSAAMVLFAGGSILYTTSQMIHQYRTDQYVAASLGLFAGIAMMFFYILRIFMSRD